MVKKKAKVAVAMSGGVDSSVAAALLIEQGYDVIGITMDFNLAKLHEGKISCCGSNIKDAKEVARALGIKHYVVNMHAQLKDLVIKEFCHEYSQGHTPNPCVRCNQSIKFGVLLKKVLRLGAGFLATGHYARISSRNNFQLRKAKDKEKDQSYFLYRLNQNQLKHIIFPIGNLKKAEVRKLAKRFKLPVAEKAGSQEICFLPDNDYRRFLKTFIRADIIPGPIKDLQGNVLGYHQGVAFYTVGQRQGLGIARGYPVYVIKINKADNAIIIGRKEEAYSSRFLVKSLNFIGAPPKKKVALKVRIRYNHKEALARLTLSRANVAVEFITPQFAVTPGQSAVFYHKDIVVGGGIIEETL